MIYQYCHKTGEFLCAKKPQKDIKQPARMVIPPYHTNKPKPSNDELAENNELWAFLDDKGMAPRSQDQGNWKRVQKQSHVTAYHKETLKPKEFTNEALITDEFTIKEPPTPYHDYADGKWVGSIKKAIDAKRLEINGWRNTIEGEESQTVLAIDSEWDAGPSARLRIDSVLLTGQMPPYWTDANNVDHKAMTLDELKQIKTAINAFGFDLHDRQRTMKKEIEALADFDKILNYPVGWPDE